MSEPTDEDYDATLREYARVDWVYSGWTPKRLHAMAEGDPDVHNWCYEGVRFACGVYPKERLAYVPGIFSRMGMQRCNTCCDRTGLPRGTGSPKNDDECRRILGLPDKAEMRRLLGIEGEESDE